MTDLAPPLCNTKFERNGSLDLTLSHCHMRRSSLATTCSESGSSSCLSEGSSSVGTPRTRTSVKFSATNFVTQRQGTLESYYEVGSLLGAGGFGEVYACEHIETGAERAVKVLVKSMDDPKANENIIKEFNVLKALDSPNLLKVYEMFEDEEHFYIISDLYRGGDLLQELEEGGLLTEECASTLMNAVLSCVNYCHKQGLVHKDLKPENILLEANKGFQDCKIIDFGLANYFSEGSKFTELEGSSYYVSPQVLQGSYTEKVDLWACGVILYIILSGFAPFDGDSDEEIMDSIEHGEYNFDDEAWDIISDDAKDFIMQLLAYDEDERPTAEEALQHPWLSEQRRSSLDSDTTKRASARHSLAELKMFNSHHCKLKQATCAILASQLLSTEEKNQIDEVFRSLDTTCDGHLDREDLRKGYREFFETDLTEEELNILFQEVNISGSGVIAYSEFCAAMMMENLDLRKLRAAYNLFDADAKGYINVDDLKRVLGMGDEKDDYLQLVVIPQVSEMDTISFEEFRHMMLSSKICQARRRSMASTPSRRRSSVAVSVASEMTADYGYGDSEEMRHNRRCSITRTPRKASLAFSVASEVSDYNCYSVEEDLSYGIAPPQISRRRSSVAAPSGDRKASLAFSVASDLDEEDFPYINNKHRQGRRCSVSRTPRRGSLAVSVTSEMTDAVSSEAEEQGKLLDHGSSQRKDSFTCGNPDVPLLSKRPSMPPLSVASEDSLLDISRIQGRSFSLSFTTDDSSISSMGDNYSKKDLLYTNEKEPQQQARQRRLCIVAARGGGGGATLQSLKARRSFSKSTNSVLEDFIEDDDFSDESNNTETSC